MDNKAMEAAAEPAVTSQPGMQPSSENAEQGAPPPYAPSMGAGPPSAPGQAYGSPYPVQQGVPAAPMAVAAQIIQPSFSSFPAQVYCHVCNKTVTSEIQFQTGMVTWAAAGLICMVGGWCGCQAIPFSKCTPSLKDVAHYCPECHTLLGIYARLN